MCSTTQTNGHTPVNTQSTMCLQKYLFVDSIIERASSLANIIPTNCFRLAFSPIFCPFKIFPRMIPWKWFSMVIVATLIIVSMVMIDLVTNFTFDKNIDESCFKPQFLFNVQCKAKV